MYKGLMEVPYDELLIGNLYDEYVEKIENIEQNISEEKLAKHDITMYTILVAHNVPSFEALVTNPNERKVYMEAIAANLYSYKNRQKFPEKVIFDKKKESTVLVINNKGTHEFDYKLTRIFPDFEEINELTDTKLTEVEQIDVINDKLDYNEKEAAEFLNITNLIINELDLSLSVESRTFASVQMGETVKPEELQCKEL